MCYCRAGASQYRSRAARRKERGADRLGREGDKGKEEKSACRARSQYIFQKRNHVRPTTKFRVLSRAVVCALRLPHNDAKHRRLSAIVGLKNFAQKEMTRSAYFHAHISFDTLECCSAAHRRDSTVTRHLTQ